MKNVLREFLQDPLKVTGAILGIVSVTIGIILGIPKVVDVIWPPFKPDRSVLLIVDTSNSMSERFGKHQTKYHSVTSEIVGHIRHEPNVVFALRFSGGQCSEEYQEPDITFSKGNGEEIRRGLAAARPRGPADFIAALEEGANDFLKYDLAQSAKIRTIWLFVGTAPDTCGDVVPLRGIKHVLEGYQGNVIFDFYSLGLSRAERKRMYRLNGTLDKLDRAESYFHAARNRMELRRDIDNASFRETPSE